MDAAIWLKSPAALKELNYFAEIAALYDATELRRFILVGEHNDRVHQLLAGSRNT